MKVPKKLEKVFHKLGFSNESDFTTATLAGFKLIFFPLVTMGDKKASKEQKEYAIARDVLTEIIALCGYLGITKLFKEYATAPLCSKHYKKKAELIEDGKIKGLDKSKISQADLDILKNINNRDFKQVAKDMKYRDPAKLKATAEQKQAFQKVQDAVKRINEAWPNNAVEAKTKIGKAFQGFKDLFSSKLKLSVPDELYKNVRVSLSHVVICTLALTFIPYVCNLIITPVMKKFKGIQDKKDKTFTTPEKLDVYPSHHQTEINKPNKGKDVKFGSYYGHKNIGNMRVGM